jgi:acyl transferase domain-containing protein/NADP-dependent 3-hydroxy acid dehydrogenase YdfG
MTRSPDVVRTPIAVVGVSALFPGSVDSTGFWTDILAGTDRITDVPPSHWLIDDHYDADITAPDRTYGRRGGFLDPVAFDAMRFGVPPSVVPSTDTAQLLALIVAQRVLDDATRGQFVELDRSRASVILGVTSGQELFGAMASRMSRPIWLQGMRRAGIAEDVALAACDEILHLHPEWTESSFPGLLGNVVAGRIANRLNLGGTNCVTDAACASSFAAISMGVNELYLGDSDLVIAGGVDTMNDIFMYMCFSKTPALSKTEDIRPFSDRADGTMLGEGLGMVALRRLEDAERDGNNIYCVINGVGSSSDGRSKSVYAPVSSGQARALDDAYAKAGYGPDTVELIEAHGTGTVAGDAAEFGGLELAFNATGRADRQWCALGSVKSQIGHTKAAAGAAGLFKVVMALHHKVLPQTAKIDHPNPNLHLEQSPFNLNTKTRPWVGSADHERRGSVSSFGFGGSNFHIALSEYVGTARRAPRLRTNDAELVVLTGTDGAAVVAEARHHLGVATTTGYLAWLAQTTQRAYHSTEPARLAIVASDEATLCDLLAKAIERIEREPDVAFSTPNDLHYGVGPLTGDVAFVFPGQGSQHLFMGSALATHFGEAMATWDLASDVSDGSGASSRSDTSLRHTVFPITSFSPGAQDANEAMLTATQWAQPAIGATSLSMLAVLEQIGLTAAHVGGHSFGEVTALHAAGVLSATDMIRIAQRRGELMAEAAQTPGSMTAVSGAIDQVRTIVEQSGIDVVVANHNSPTQVVLSGSTEAITQMEGALGAFGFACKRLPVATAFHSPIVSGASDAFAEFLNNIAFDSPTVPVYANETAAPYPTEPAAMRAQLGRQLANPVRFVEMIEAMHGRGARTFVEVGPAATLTGLIGQILKSREHRAIRLDKKNPDSLAAFLDGIAQLAAAGAYMNLGALGNDYADLTNPHDITKPALTLMIDGSNYDSPYPPKDLADLVGPNVTPASTQPVVTAAAATPTGVTPASTPTAATAATPTGVTPVFTPTAVPAVVTPIARPAVAAPPVSVPIPMASPAVPVASPGVFAAYQAMQQQTAEAHTAYLNSMAQAHSAFLDAAHRSIAVLGQLAGLATPTSPVVQSAAPSIVAAAPQTFTPVPVTAPTATPPLPVIVPQVMAPAPGATPMPTAPPPAAPQAMTPPSVASASRAPVAVTPPPSTEALTAALLDVVAERTGYPASMLTLTMELESDLGIDSIKRVEILSAINTAIPDLPEVDITVMAKLNTLGQIVDYLASEINTPASVASSAAVASAANVTSTLSSDALTAALLDVVADRTGYPASMLTLTMELESDLGIDSIKRVEILSAINTAIPDLPEVDITVMAKLNTLGQIVDYLMQTTPVSVSAPPPSTAPALDTGSNGSLGRYVLEVVETPSTDSQMRGLRDGPIAVADDGSGVASALVARLMAAGIDAAVETVVPRSGYAGVIFLGGLRDLTNVDEAVAVNRDGFASAQAAAGGLFVTVSALGGAFGSAGSDPAQAWASGLTALARTAAREWSLASVKAIDIERGGRDSAAIADAIAHELLHGATELEVGLKANGERVTLRSVPVEVEPGSLPVGADDVIVVSGGGRGVTAACVIELARASKATFVLLGRSQLVDEPDAHRFALDDASLKRSLLSEATSRGHTLTPAELSAAAARIATNREIRSTIAAVEHAGGRAHYLRVDISDTGSVADAFAIVGREHGAVTGLIHGAGVLADKLIVDKTTAQFDTVFDTKVVGLRNLLSSSSADALRLLCVFSSVAARTGNVGQADYAMANEVLNKVAINEGLRRPNCVVKSIGWGPWAGGMVGPSLQAHFDAIGVSLIDLAAGARMFVAELSTPQHEQVDVVLGDGVVARVSV